MRQANSIRDGFGFKAEAIGILEVSDLQGLRKFVLDCWESGREIKTLGNATNVLFARERLSVWILKLEGKFFKGIQQKGRTLEVGAGVEIRDLLHFCIKNELAGLEFLVGIPGRVGGAVVGNAGAFGNEIAELVLSAEIMDRAGNCRRMEKDEIEFGYRYSSLKGGILLKVQFQLSSSSRAKVKKKIKTYFFRRMESQELKAYSCGCFFKNPAGESTREILRTLGLRGKSRGGALVSPKHENFLLSQGSARPDDILSLKDMVQRKVWREKGIWLEPEVEIIW